MHIASVRLSSRAIVLKCLGAMAFLMLCTPLSMLAQKPYFRPFRHWNDRMAVFRSQVHPQQGCIVMMGNSLTEFGRDWNKKLRADTVIVNRGIMSDYAAGMSRRVNEVKQLEPSVVFLSCGINDLSHALTAQRVAADVIALVGRMHNEMPSVRLYVQSILPINESFGRWKSLSGRTDDIPVANALIKEYCDSVGIQYVDLFSAFVKPGTNIMRRELTADGLHLTPMGYKVWASVLQPLIDALKEEQ